MEDNIEEVESNLRCRICGAREDHQAGIRWHILNEHSKDEIVQALTLMAVGYDAEGSVFLNRQTATAMGRSVIAIDMAYRRKVEEEGSEDPGPSPEALDVCENLGIEYDD